MANYKETEYGKIPFDWSFTTGQEYCDKVTDGTHDSPKKRLEGNYLITSKHIKGRHIDFENAYLISDEDYEKVNRRSRVHQWDVIISMIGEYCGFTYVERNSTINYAIKNVGLFKTSDKFKSLWIHYFLQSRLGKHIIGFNKSGSSQPYISLGALRALPILIPKERNEQNLIVEVLSSLDDKIDLLHRQNKTLEGMAEVLFREWFVEKVEDDWEERELGDFISVKHGYAFKGKYILPEPNNQVLVTPGNFKIGGGFKSHKFKYFHHDDYPKEYVFNTGDLIVTMTDLSKMGDTLGYSAIIPNTGNSIYLHNQRVGKVIIENPISKWFLYYLMKTKEYQWYVLGSSTGTSVRHTSPSRICEYSFLLPSKDKLEEFESIAEKLYKKVLNNQDQIQTLEKLRDTLLPKLMSGEVRVEY